MKLSKRLEVIANMISENSIVYDIGCDHGLLDIYLTNNKNCECIASDISENVLINTKKNISKYNLDNEIQIVCSDGLKNLNIKKDSIIVISGMGTNTIIDILNNQKTSIINNLIIQSNNEIELLREKIINLGFYIYDEKIIEDNKKTYIIIYFKRGFNKYKKIDYLFGPIARKDIVNKEYFKKLYDKNKIIYSKIPYKHILEKINKYLYIRKIKKFTVYCK